MQYPRKKKPRKISDSVFRGKKAAYSFQVFPITADIPDTPAVFILSRRRTDKLGHGHQSAVCIGETESVRSELKKHKRAKCVKNNEPNVICILEDVNPKARLGVIEDLTAARSFGCIQNVYDLSVKAKQEPTLRRTIRLRALKSEVGKLPVIVNIPAAAGNQTKKTTQAIIAHASAVKRSTATSKPAKLKAAKSKGMAAKQSAGKPGSLPTKTTRNRVAAAVGGMTRPKKNEKTIIDKAAAKKSVKTSGSATAVKKTSPKRADMPAGLVKKQSASSISSARATAKTVKSLPKSPTAKPAKKQNTLLTRPIPSKRPKATPATKTRSAKAKQPANATQKAGRSGKPTQAVKRAAVATRSLTKIGASTQRPRSKPSSPKKPISKQLTGRTLKKTRARQKAAA